MTIKKLRRQAGIKLHKLSAVSGVGYAQLFAILNVESIKLVLEPGSNLPPH